MKKLFIYTLLTFGILAFSTDVNTAKANQGKRYEKNYYYKKGKISHEELPTSVKKYLKDTYPDHDVVIAKRKGDGYYYVKIRYNHNYKKPYYRSLVFDPNGKIVKG